MPCYKDLGLCALKDSNIVLGSAQFRTSDRLVSRSAPDLHSWDPAKTRAQGRANEIRHADILRQSAERHMARCGHLMPKMRCDTNFEESRWHHRISSDAPPISKLSLGL